MLCEPPKFRTYKMGGYISLSNKLSFKESALWFLVVARNKFVKRYILMFLDLKLLYQKACWLISQKSKKCEENSVYGGSGAAGGDSRCTQGHRNHWFQDSQWILDGFKIKNGAWSWSNLLSNLAMIILLFCNLGIQWVTAISHTTPPSAFLLLQQNLSPCLPWRRGSVFKTHT